MARRAQIERNDERKHKMLLIQMSSKMHKELKEAAARREETMSHLVRRACRNLIEKETK